ncbi:hypothetical protein PR048_004089 [Dryococelus australis]|uniref:Uncharacterized protein n=1 Tax=Dryococelus australis TaxID=614101 RepID=A0ABQ9I5D5_9NEOP|nr:hypothetical protein PR048_004089 [Dryococelus australis]
MKCLASLLYTAGKFPKHLGAAVAERSARSPPTKANRVQIPAGSPDIRKWESCRAMPLVSGPSSGISRFPPPPPPIPVPLHIHFNLPHRLSRPRCEILTTDRPLDREQRDEHILEVSGSFRSSLYLAVKWVNTHASVVCSPVDKPCAPGENLGRPTCHAVARKLSPLRRGQAVGCPAKWENGVLTFGALALDEMWHVGDGVYMCRESWCVRVSWPSVVMELIWWKPARTVQFSRHCTPTPSPHCPDNDCAKRQFLAKVTEQHSRVCLRRFVPFPTNTEFVFRGLPPAIDRKLQKPVYTVLHKTCPLMVRKRFRVTVYGGCCTTPDIDSRPHTSSPYTTKENVSRELAGPPSPGPPSRRYPMRDDLAPLSRECNTLANCLQATSLSHSGQGLANWVQSPAKSADFRKWESCRNDAVVRRVFSGISRFPNRSLQCRSVFTSIALIGSQDLAHRETEFQSPRPPLPVLDSQQHDSVTEQVSTQKCSSPGACWYSRSIATSRFAEAQCWVQPESTRLYLLLGVRDPTAANQGASCARSLASDDIMLACAARRHVPCSPANHSSGTSVSARWSGRPLALQRGQPGSSPGAAPKLRRRNMSGIVEGRRVFSGYSQSSHTLAPLAHTVFDTSCGWLVQSPLTVTTVIQCAADIGIFVRRTVDAGVQVIELANFSGRGWEKESKRHFTSRNQLTACLRTSNSHKCVQWAQKSAHSMSAHLQLTTSVCSRLGNQLTACLRTSNSPQACAVGSGNQLTACLRTSNSPQRGAVGSEISSQHVCAPPTHTSVCSRLRNQLTACLRTSNSPQVCAVGSEISSQHVCAPPTHYKRVQNQLTACLRTSNSLQACAVGSKSAHSMSAHLQLTQVCAVGSKSAHSMSAHLQLTTRCAVGSKSAHSMSAHLQLTQACAVGSKSAHSMSAHSQLTHRCAVARNSYSMSAHLQLTTSVCSRLRNQLTACLRTSNSPQACAVGSEHQAHSMSAAPPNSHTRCAVGSEISSQHVCAPPTHSQLKSYSMSAHLQLTTSVAVGSEISSQHVCAPPTHYKACAVGSKSAHSMSAHLQLTTSVCSRLRNQLTACLRTSNSLQACCSRLEISSQHVCAPPTHTSVCSRLGNQLTACLRTSNSPQSVAVGSEISSQHVCAPPTHYKVCSRLEKSAHSMSAHLQLTTSMSAHLQLTTSACSRLKKSAHSMSAHLQLTQVCAVGSKSAHSMCCAPPTHTSVCSRLRNQLTACLRTSNSLQRCASRLGNQLTACLRTSNSLQVCAVGSEISSQHVCAPPTHTSACSRLRNQLTAVCAPPTHYKRVSRLGNQLTACLRTSNSPRVVQLGNQLTACLRNSNSPQARAVGSEISSQHVCAPPTHYKRVHRLGNQLTACLRTSNSPQACASRLGNQLTACLRTSNSLQVCAVGSEISSQLSAHLQLTTSVCSRLGNQLTACLRTSNSLQACAVGSEISSQHVCAPPTHHSVCSRLRNQLTACLRTSNSLQACAVGSEISHSMSAHLQLTTSVCIGSENQLTACLRTSNSLQACAVGSKSAHSMSAHLQLTTRCAVGSNQLTACLRTSNSLQGVQ